MKRCGHLLRKKLTRLASIYPEMSSVCWRASASAHATVVVSLGIAEEEAKSAQAEAADLEEEEGGRRKKEEGRRSRFCACVRYLCQTIPRDELCVACLFLVEPASWSLPHIICIPPWIIAQNGSTGSKLSSPPSPKQSCSSSSLTYSLTLPLSCSASSSTCARNLPPPSPPPPGSTPPALSSPIDLLSLLLLRTRRKA